MSTERKSPQRKTSSVTTEQNKVGRPTKYKPEYCDKVIQLGEQGYTKEEMALELRIMVSTLYCWCDDHAEFSEAIKEAVSLSQGFMEKIAREALGKPANAFNTPLWSKIVSCRFRDVYREQTVVKHGGLEGGLPIPVVAATVPVTANSMNEWYKQVVDRRVSIVKNASAV